MQSTESGASATRGVTKEWGGEAAMQSTAKGWSVHDGKFFAQSFAAEEPRAPNERSWMALSKLWLPYGFLFRHSASNAPPPSCPSAADTSSDEETASSQALSPHAVERAAAHAGTGVAQHAVEPAAGLLPDEVYQAAMDQLDMGVIRAWLQAGGSINAVSASREGPGYTLLMMAVVHGHRLLALEALQRGANIEVRTWARALAWAWAWAWVWAWA